MRVDEFLKSETGGATVDWVVGAAAGIGLTIAVMNSVGDAVHDHAERIEAKFLEIGIKSY